eukprot:g3749.t1
MNAIGISTPLIRCPQPLLKLHSSLSRRHPGHHQRLSVDPYHRHQFQQLHSSEVEPTTESETSVSPESDDTELDPSFIFAFSTESLPKGVRKEAVIDGKQIVVFWYRNEIFACETRSPAEGAFSTGLLNASFTADYGIICPGTNTVFSIKTGEILDWYPNNFVLKTLIPKDTCRPLEVYPVKLTDDGIYISFKGGSQGGVGAMKSKGGANTSLEDNNVFGLEPKMYADERQSDSNIEAGGVSVNSAASKLRDVNPATIFISTIAIGIVSVAGTAAAIYYESIPALIAFWVVLFGIVAFVISNVLGFFETEKQE